MHGHLNIKLDQRIFKLRKWKIHEIFVAIMGSLY